MATADIRYSGAERSRTRSDTRSTPQRRARAERSGWGQRANGNGGGEGLAEALGWFSIGLGLAELLAPRRVAHLIGINDGDARATLLAVGLREIASGIGILTQPRSAGWLWARAGGDVMDLALLGSALNSNRNDPNRIAGAITVAVGAAALDVYAGQRLQQHQYPTRQSEYGYGPGPVRTRRTEPRGVHVMKTITVNRPPEEVYSFWHDFQNLPRFMSHLESVQVMGERRSHWKAKAPAGQTVEWEAEVIDDQPNELISWRSIEGADVNNAGTVRFKAAPGGRGTEIHVDLRYDPPAGKLGAMIAKLFGEEPGEQIGGDLRRFKQVMETGEVVHSDSSIHRGMHPARPPAENERVRMVGSEATRPHSRQGRGRGSRDVE
jgi:uncharacterized membrane protein